jgi:hypothetical protein
MYGGEKKLSTQDKIDIGNYTGDKKSRELAEQYGIHPSYVLQLRRRHKATAKRNARSVGSDSSVFDKEYYGE